MSRLAVIMTAFNRRAKTLAATKTLLSQQLEAGVQISILLTDDGSTDGTTDAIREEFPKVHILQGDGSLFWNGGMRLAFATAMEKDFDYYLWLNDDTNLYPDAIPKLISTSSLLGSKNIIVGSTSDSVTGTITYGGMRRVSWWNPFRYELVNPGDEPLPVDTMNGNCVLIPRLVAQKVGNIDSNYIHSIGDIDYGLTAKKLGFGVYICAGVVGTCSKNSISGTWQDPTLPIGERWRKMQSPKGLPLRQWIYLSQKHAGILWPVIAFLPLVRFLRLSAKSLFDHFKRSL